MFKRIIWIVGTAMSIAIIAVGAISSAKDVSTMGIPSWLWFVAGYCILMGVGIYSVFQISNENKNLKKKIDDVNYTTFRQTQIDFRKQFEDRMEIPNLMSKLNITCASIIAKQKMPEDTKQLGKIARSILFRMNIFAWVVVSLPFYKVIFKKQATLLTVMMMKNINSALADYNLGVVVAAKQKPYKLIYDRIIALELHLPTQITNKINTYIQTSDCANSLNLMSPERHFWKRVSFLPGNMKNTLSYMAKNIDNVNAVLPNEVSQDIQNFLLANDIKT